MIRSLFLLILIFLPCHIAAQDLRPPLPEEERLTYRILWNGVLVVGKSVLTLERHGGEYFLEMEARSVNPVDLFFTVRDRFFSRINAKLTSFIFYEKRVREGGYKRHDVIHYDEKENLLTYIKNGKLKKRIKLSPPIFDPFSVLYVYRFTCDEAEACKIRTTDGKHVEEVEVVPLGVEKVKVAAGNFETVKVEPRWKKMRGVFKRKKGGHIFVWFTRDSKKLPVKVEAHIFLGKIVGELTGVIYARQRAEKGFNTFTKGVTPVYLPLLLSSTCTR